MTGATSRGASTDPAVWRVRGHPLVAAAQDGPLAGLRIAVKDVVAVRGHAIGAGNPTWLREAPVEAAHAAALADLLAAGASVEGIARTDELAYALAGENAHHGTPPNPAVPGALPGGSTSGPAAAVALGQADVALGTDTAGSIRVPASYQGLWGLRTTHGLVSRDGVLPLAPSFDTVGWLTRDAATLGRVVGACLPYLPADGLGGLPLRVPVEVLDVLDGPTRTAFEHLVATLGAGSVQVGELGAHADAFRTVQGAEAWRAHGRWVDAHPGALGPAVAARMATAAGVAPDDEAKARAHAAALRELVRGLGGVLVVPAAPGPAPRRGLDAAAAEQVRSRTLRLTALAGLAGLPAVCVPALRVPDARIAGGDGSAPVGFCLVGPAGSDRALVDLARNLLDGLVAGTPGG